MSCAPPARLPGGFTLAFSRPAWESRRMVRRAPASLAGKVTDITSPALGVHCLPRAVRTVVARAAMHTVAVQSSVLHT